jgi:hypothetical protein
VKYGIEWTPALVLFGMVIVLPLAPAFAMILLVVVALAALAAVVALAGAVVATPYLVVRTVRRHLAARHRQFDRNTLSDIEWPHVGPMAFAGGHWRAERGAGLNGDRAGR